MLGTCVFETLPVLCDFRSERVQGLRLFFEKWYSSLIGKLFPTHLLYRATLKLVPNRNLKNKSITDTDLI